MAGAGGLVRRNGVLRAGVMRLDDKYVLEEGTIALSGVQALVRLPLDQHLSLIHI